MIASLSSSRLSGSVSSLLMSLNRLLLAFPYDIFKLTVCLPVCWLPYLLGSFGSPTPTSRPDFVSGTAPRRRPETSMLISHNKITNIPTLIGPPMTLLSSNWLRYLVRYLVRFLLHLLNIQDPIQNCNYKTADSSLKILSN